MEIENEDDHNSISIDDESLIETEVLFDEEKTIESPIKDASTAEKVGTVEKQKFLRFPLARVKNIMKIDSECGLINKESVIAVTKATELFLQLLTRETLRFTLSSKRKTILKKDLEAAINSISQFCFLDGSLD